MATIKKSKGTVAKKAVVEKLAIDGGKPVNTKPFPGWPSFEESTAKKVAEVLLSGKVNYWTGKVGMEFEKEWAKWLGIRNAISVTNGTAALHVALGGLNIGPGDEVICTSYSFIASSFCACQAGALPVFCDCGDDHCLDPDKIEPLINERSKGFT